MLVLKVPKGMFNLSKIKSRFAGCTVSLKNEGNTTLVMVEGLKVRLNVDAEIYFVETCRISSSPQHQGHIHGHREQPAPIRREQPTSTHHGRREQPAPTHHGRREQPVPTSSQGPMLSQGAWLCPKSNNGA